MRLDSFGFGWAKGFEGHHRYHLRDLNLLFGANSSGKSTVFQSLLLMQQSAVRTGPIDHGVLEFRGSAIDLGGFRTFVHGHNTDNPLHLELELHHPGTPHSLVNFMRGTIRLGIDFGVGEDESRPYITNVEIQNEGIPVRFSRVSDGTMRLENAQSSAFLVDRYVEALRALEPRPKGFALPNDADRRWLREWLRKHDAGMTGWIPAWSPSLIGPGKPGRPAGGTLRSPRQQMLQMFVYSWWNWTHEFWWQVTTLLDEITYVGPLRAFPRRVVTEAGSGDRVGSRGERLVLHLARRPELVDRVNECFGILDIGYKLSVEQLRAHGAEDALGDVAIAVLTDRLSGVSLSPADVGFGLSQVLPVVVQLMGNTESIILIEQPEIHLHPRLQGRLGDILLTSARDNGNQILVETHSEHLLTRIQRRMRENKTTSQPSVSLSYVSNLSGSSAMQRISMGTDGRIDDPWPDEFIDERLDDLFASL